MFTRKEIKMKGGIKMYIAPKAVEIKLPAALSLELK